MLRGRSRRGVVHVRGQLTHDVPRGRRDGRRSAGHGWRRLVVHHVRGARALRVLHGVADGRRRGRRRTEVLLRHEVVRMGHDGRLRGVVSRMVVRRGLGRSRRHAVPARARVVLDGHRYEVAVLPGGYRGDPEGLGAQAGAGGRLVVRVGQRLVVGVVRRAVGHVHVVLGQVRRGHAVSVRVVGGRRGQVERVWSAAARGGGGLPCPHVAVVDVSLEVTLRQIRAFAAGHHRAHPQGAALALLDPLHRV